ncbi:MAG: Na-Ca exchanger/integrin-beta4 [Solirubrobacterales bacterium]|nr:Na-Ca exchanger/integrin-beta4 [Solirubrobacterales bacterium]
MQGMLQRLSTRARFALVATVLVGFYGGGAFALTGAGQGGDSALAAPICSDDGSGTLTQTCFDTTTGTVTTVSDTTTTKTDVTTTTTITDTTTTKTTGTDTGASAISIGDASVKEGDSGTVDVVFPLTRVGGIGGKTGVQYTTGDGTAVAPGDYTGVSGFVTFFPGEDTKEIRVPVAGDTLVEGDEVLKVTLSGPVKPSRLARESATGTIIDDDKQGDLSCRASVLRALGLEPLVANKPDLPCRDDARELASVNQTIGPLGVFGSLHASVLRATTDATPDDPAARRHDGDGGSARATVAALDLTVLGVHVQANALRGDASLTCVKGTAQFAGSSTITGLKVNGVPVGTENPVTIPLGSLGGIYIGRVQTGTDRVITRALEVDLPVLGQNIAIGEAIADLHGGPCS